MIRKIRITSQILFFSLFTGLFFFVNRYPTAYTHDSDILLKLNPFSALIVSIASREVISSMVIGASIVLIISMVFGRIFCGFFCPLGALIDFFDTYLFNKYRSKKRIPPSSLHHVKYIILSVSLLLAVTGVTLSLVLDPLAITTRLYTIIAYPTMQAIVALGSQAYQKTLSFLHIDLFNYPKILQPLMYGTAGAIGLFILTFCGGLIDKRFYCQYLCPTGAFLAIVSRFSFFRRVATTCNNCAVCSHTCPTHAINETDCTKTAVSECILCGKCDLSRPCSRLKLVIPDLQSGIGININKRHSILALAGTFLLTPVFKFTAMARYDGTGRFIRPPGAVPEVSFSARCIACGECIKVCPMNALQPAFGPQQIHRAFTPQLVPRIGGCEEKCYLCGHVCPTEAIRSLTLAEKRYAKIGTAVIDLHRCIAWEQNRECLVCDEVCPYNAIEFKILPTVKGLFKVPIVREDLCVGCGLCEQKCPVFDEAAIVVYRFGENRIFRGQYLTDFQKQSIENRRKQINDRTADINTAAVPLQDKSPGIQPEKPVQQHSLPPGFSFD